MRGIGHGKEGLPYVPSRFEDFVPAGRSIRADVHGWLAARLPKGSRLR